MDDKLEALKQTSIFSALDKKHLQAVAKITDRVHVKEGRILIYEGQVVTHMYMIIEGSASVKLDDKVVATLGPGAVIGELAMVDDAPSSATVTIEEESTVWLIPRAGFLPVWKDYPEISHAMLKAVVARLRDADKLLHG